MELVDEIVIKAQYAKKSVLIILDTTTDTFSLSLLCIYLDSELIGRWITRTVSFGHIHHSFERNDKFISTIIKFFKNVNRTEPWISVVPVER